MPQGHYPPDEPLPPAPPPSANVGVIVTGLVFGVILCYFVVGLVVKRKRGHTGWDALPNAGLWLGLGSGVRNGGARLLNRVRGRTATAAEAAPFRPYERL